MIRLCLMHTCSRDVTIMKLAQPSGGAQEPFSQSPVFELDKGSCLVLMGVNRLGFSSAKLTLDTCTSLSKAMGGTKANTILC